MGNTRDEGNRFPDWLRRELFDRRMTVADLARAIVRNEGIDEGDVDDFARRTKAVHGLISNVINQVASLGIKTARKIADALELPQEDVMEIAGLIERGKSRSAQASRSGKSDARQKIDRLIDMLSPEEQEQAIEILETFRKRREAEIKAASQRRLKKI